MSRAPIDLSGTWRASVADEDLRRSYPEASFDDGDWASIAVPGHWRSNPAFAASDGPLLVRRRFADPPAQVGARRWLTFDGIFYTSDVWLDGSYLGDTEGYFFPHTFEVTDELAETDEHVVALEVACARPQDLIRKRNLTGVFEHWDLGDQDRNPGGIWRGVHLDTSGAVRIRHLRVLCREATEQRATVFVRAVLDSADARPVQIRTTLTDPDGAPSVELEREQPLAAGENQLEWTVPVANPRLWWPWSLGEQPRYQVAIEVRDEEGVSDEATRSIGLRRVEMHDWIMSVNGERLFLKGANQGPSMLALGEASRELLTGDVRLARDLGLDLLRVHGHVSRPELYEAADDLGMLLWQDLPLQWGYARTVRTQARRQAREAVDLLGHHPSVVVWCGHNSPLAIDVRPSVVGDQRRRARLAARTAVGQLLPSWNKTILDRSISSVLHRTDGSRPVVPHSGVWPHPPQLDGTDTHLYLGWYGGEVGQLPRLLRWWPRLARFVSEFGAQAVPDDAAFLEPERWPRLDWERAWRVHGLQKPFFDRFVPPDAHETFESWQQATQRYQAELVRSYVETLRRLKYRPTGGFAQFCLADGAEGVSWSLYDHRRRPKLAAQALAEACRPLAIVASGLPPTVHAGERLTVPLHAINDLHISTGDIVALAHLSWRQQGQDRSTRWSWGGEVPTDSCVRVATVDTVVPPADDALTLTLELHRQATGRPGEPEVLATNSYRTHLER